MTDDEKFLFDLWGYIVVEDVLTPDEVAVANEAVDRHLVVNRQPGLSHRSKKLAAKTGRGEFNQNPLTFERPWCDALSTDADASTGH